jgi:hypothetical protein
MHVPINVKSSNNTSKWQMGFNSAFKGLISYTRNRVDKFELDSFRMMDCSERGNGIVSTQYVEGNNFGIPATCFAKSGPDLEGKCII